MLAATRGVAEALNLNPHHSRDQGKMPHPENRRDESVQVFEAALLVQPRNVAAIAWRLEYCGGRRAAPGAILALTELLLDACVRAGI
jgi:hypothetical protein